MKRSISVCLILLVPFLILVSAGCGKSPEEKRGAYLKSAASYMKEGKYAEAAIQYQNALKIAPDDTSTLMALGEVNLKRMRGDEAYRAFARAAKVDPKNTKAHQYLAYMLLMAKKYDMAEKEARTILSYDAKNRDAKEILAQAAFNGGKQEEAIGIARELLNDPKPPEADFTNAAGMYLATKRYDEAVSVIDRGISLYPGSATIRFMASDVYVAKGDIPLARKWAEEAYQNNRKNLGAGLTLARFYAAHKMDDLFASLLAELKASFPKEPGPYLLESTYLQGRHELDKAIAAAEKGRALQDTPLNRTQVAQLYLEKGDLQKAEALLKEAVDKDPKIIPARILLAQIYLRQQNAQKALDILDPLVKNVPKRPDVASAAAQAYLIKGDLTKARSFVEGSLPENRNSVVLHSMMAKIQFAQGNYKEALAEVELLGRYALMQPDILYVGILAAFSLNQPDKAAAFTDTLARIAPDSWSALHARSLVALSRKDRKGAYAAADRAVTLYPRKAQALALYAGIAPSVVSMEQAIGKITGLCGQNNTASCHMVLSRMLEASGNTDGSLAQLKAASALEPENASIVHAVAQFYMRHNMGKQAMDEYENLLNKNPNDMKAAVMLAQLNQGQGNIKDAKKVYTYIIERDPKNALAANNLSWILAETGSSSDLNEALRLAQIAKEKFPDDPRIADTLGYVYLKKGLVQNSLGQFQLALEKLPQEPSINYHMALALVQLSRGPEARKYAEAAAGSKTAFPERDQAQKLLARINSGAK